MISIASMFILLGCGASDKLEEAIGGGNDSNQQPLVHTEGKCLPLNIELIESSQGINEYRVTTNVQDNTDFVSVDMRVNEAVVSGPIQTGRQLQWQVSAIRERRNSVYEKIGYRMY